MDPPNMRPDAGVWSDDEVEVLEHCPACGSTEFSTCLPTVPDPTQPRARAWSFSKCHACGSMFLNPRPTEATIHRAYLGSYYTHTDPPAEDDWPRSRGTALRERLLKGYINRRFGYTLAPATSAGSIVVPLLPGARGMGSSHVRDLPAPVEGSRLLDVGCGNGAFLVRMRAAGWSVAGIEPDPEARRHASAAGLRVEAGPEIAEAFPGERFRAITLNHVLEHVHDPRAVLRACAQALDAGGSLWVAVPSGGAAGIARFGAHWYPLDPPRHLVLFTPDALRAAFTDAGLVAVTSPPPTLLATRWTYRASRAFEQGEDDPLAPRSTPVADVIAAMTADLGALMRSGKGEELVMRARAPQ
jgi:2-polyprenyl-3-methyl-5-hydroxy-6-metoxy-1,4-benzoquinol methylase